MGVEKKDLIWGYLIHLGFNMWCDRETTEFVGPHWCAKPFLRCDRTLWRELVDRMAEAGVNLLVIDLGEGVRYETHPEIAVEGSWAPQRLREELVFIRSKGIEPIPKFNFSTGHDAWLGEYSRCVSTEKYYGVCRDLIAEAIDLFDRPRLFHLGMDEETAEHQRTYSYLVIRQSDLWWHDLELFVKQVETGGSRAWVWSDHVWRHPDEFFASMPRSVLQSNWYYGREFPDDRGYVKAYDDLEEHGYDQVPTGSNWTAPTNFEDTVRYARGAIDPSRLKGFLQTVWKPTIQEFREDHLAAIGQVGKARRLLESGS